MSCGDDSKQNDILRKVLVCSDINKHGFLYKSVSHRTKHQLMI